MRVPSCLRVFVVCALWPAFASGQQLLDRVVARVNNVPITLSDVNAAIGLGIVGTPSTGDAVAAARVQLIDRQLMLAEVARFAPPEPDARAVDTEAARLRAHAGDRLPALMRDTGVDDQRLRDLARDTLRIRAYLDQRFGAVSDAARAEAVAQWVRDLRARAEIASPRQAP
jgi:hypothetical protein